MHRIGSSSSSKIPICGLIQLSANNCLTVGIQYYITRIARPSIYYVYELHLSDDFGVTRARAPKACE